MLNRRFAQPSNVGFGAANKAEMDGQLSEKALQRILQAARAEGRLNLANKGLDSVPNAVWNLYNSQEDVNYSLDKSSSWWEIAELVRLILADNSIQVVDEKIGEFGALEFVDLHNNLISNLPSSFSSLQNISMLNLSFNRLSVVPDEIQRLSKLSVLLLSNNQITSVPVDLFTATPLLTQLDLSNNRLVGLPRLSGLTKLVKLNISRNVLTTMPDVSGLIKLSDLEAFENKIASFSTPVSALDGRDIQLPGLRRIDLRQNRLSNVSVTGINVIAPQLKEIIISFNAFKSLTFILANSPILQIIDLRDNSLDQVPEEILSLKHLKRLDIQNNNIRALPPRLGLLKELSFIGFEGNILKGLPKHVGTTGLLKWLADKISQDDLNTQSNTTAIPISKNIAQSNANISLSNLSLDTSSSTSSGANAISHGRQSFERISSATTNCNTISSSATIAEPQISGSSKNTKADLSKQNLDIDGLLLVTSKLPSSTVILNLDNNCLTTELPKTIFVSLQSMRELSMPYNQLIRFDFSILPKTLSSLDLSHNRLTTLTPVTIDLPSMSTLDLSFNKLTAFELDLSRTSLHVLVLATNQIAEVQEDIVLAAATTLTHFDISNNALVKLPIGLGRCPLLQVVRIEGNLFRIPRWDVVQRGSEAILKWCKERCV